MGQFMVEFDLPPHFSEDFIDKIPQQRSKVDELMDAGKVLSCSLSIDRQKMWCIIKAQTEDEVTKIIAQFPLIHYMDFLITELMFNNSVPLRMPLFSMN